MAKLSKRQNVARDRVDRTKQYGVDEAISLLSELAKNTKFKESVDVAVNLGIDPRKADQNVRGSTTLPHGTGKSIKVAVFAQGENAEVAEAAGADVVGFEDLADRIKDGEYDFDVVLATPDCMRVVGQLGRILGPRGLMPNPKSNTVTQDIGPAVAAAKSGTVQFRADRGGVVHGSIGQVGQEPGQIKDNLCALIEDLRKAKPASSKGTYMQRITLSSTMGPGIAIEPASLEA